MLKNGSPLKEKHLRRNRAQANDLGQIEGLVFRERLGQDSLPLILMRLKQLFPSNFRIFTSTALSLYLALLLADSACGIADISLHLCGISLLSTLNNIVGCVKVFACILVYLSIGVNLATPKRFFLPLVFFILLANLLFLEISTNLLLDPLVSDSQLAQFSWMLSLVLFLSEGAIGLIIVSWIQGGLRWRWPLFPEKSLGPLRFSWLNTIGFMGINVFLVLLLLFYLGSMAARIIDRASHHYLVLHNNRLASRVETYAREDGKTIILIPMMHIGSKAFYQRVLACIPSSSMVLTEGVKDRKHLLPQGIDYTRVASKLGLSSQQKIFKPSKQRNADMDLEDFCSPQTIAFLKVVCATYQTKNLASFLTLQGQQVLLEHFKEDLLIKRNCHLLSEINKELLCSNQIAVPWGAEHMIGISQALQQEGFHLTETQEVPIFYFRTIW